MRTATLRPASLGLGMVLWALGSARPVVGQIEAPPSRTLRRLNALATAYWSAVAQDDTTRLAQLVAPDIDTVETENLSVLRLHLYWPRPPHVRASAYATTTDTVVVRYTLLPGSGTPTCLAMADQLPLIMTFVRRANRWLVLHVAVDEAACM